MAITANQFVTLIHEATIENNIRIYLQLFDSTKSGEAKDAYWKEALTLYNSLTDEHQRVLFRIVR